MSLPLPPKSIIRCDAPTAQLVHNELTSVIAGHAQATTTYRFYEELDTWLGPWGEQGYPIAYGKFYNVAFTSNQKLMNNAQARNWVWRTTIFLQEALRDYAVGRIRNGTIPSLTEPELRRAAFDSHPAAYDMGGLSMLCLTAPELIPVIATIPSREFNPTSDNFGPTIAQVFITLGRITPQTVGNSLGAMAGPAHTGLFSRAFQQDQQNFRNQIALSQELGNIRMQLERGELDYIVVLDQIISSLNQRQFPDQGFAQAARELVQLAQARRQRLVQQTTNILQTSPEVRQRVERSFPTITRP
jgi:hypothetical protein